MSARVLYVIACAAGPAPHVATLVRQAQERAWDVCLIGTPAAVEGGFLDVPALGELTGHPVRHTYRRPGDPASLPKADAIAVAPMTLNTLTKWADGHADTFALGTLTEAIGLKLPIAALPFFNAAQAAHPAVDRAVKILRRCKVNVLYGAAGFEPHPPGTGDSRIPTYPWHLVLDALET